ncbi:hypothetical protein [Ammonifex thiophilus]|uniref:Uncharacterized protein n=1 Tax=Ammonifex thiophilus TaxID=444093 RepID=A0A3D8P492_9THEO|nr:hypothetical protein [Ammonifex thiophilus]RDV83923.1 hypothetical protein DXX99_03555 [Ammonifex thiophilus]
MNGYEYVEVRFPEGTGEKCRYWGQNGTGRCVGLFVEFDHEEEVVTLWPVNTRGRRGKCFIKIPYGEVPALIGLLEGKTVRKRVSLE